MRMRKVFAGIAALATLLGGLAVGAGAAQATPTLGKNDVTSIPGAITVVNAQEGHTYSAYKIASFFNVKGSDNKVASLDVQTESKWVEWLNSALRAANLYEQNYADNPAARLATLTADEASTVVNKISPTSVAESGVTPDAKASNESAKPKTLILTGENGAPLADGWYVVSDYASAGVSKKVALVATTITVGGTTYTKFTLNEAADQSDVKDALGVFYAKDENTPDAPNKTVYKDGKAWEKNSVNVGDQLDYTVQSAISQSAVNYQSGYPYKIMDRASRGLTVNVDSIKIVVSGDRAGTNSQTLIKGKDADYTVKVTVGEDKTTTTVITFADTVAPNHAGEYVTMTYKATVNADAVSAGQYSRIDKTTGQPVSPSQDIAAGTVTNRVYVQHNGGEWTDPGERTVYTGAFEFQKYGAAQKDTEGLNNVQFEVYAGKEATGKPLKFTKNNDGSYTYDPNGQGTVFTVTSATIGGKKGVVSLKGLQGATSDSQKSGDDSTGVYTIKETKTVDGYTQQILATFSVQLKVSDQGVSTVSLLQAANNSLSLASESNGAIRVKNVQNVTQLPLTGAAGITLFAVIAVLFAVVAAILIVKFRSARRELEA